MSIRLSICACLIATAVFSGCSVNVATLEFVELLPPQPRLGEVATVRFKAKDYRGEPMAGAEVTFSLATDQPGATLDPIKVTTLKGSGYAETQLVVTSRVTSVVVVAKSGTLTVESPPLSFAGSVNPNQKQFTFQCGTVAGTASGGIHALGAFDPTRYLVAGEKVKCYAHTADRNGNGVPGALVSFITEAGTIGPTNVTSTDVIGNAEILYKTSYPIPKETDPVNWIWTPQNDTTHTGEYSAPLWMHPFQWTSRPILSYLMTPNLQEPRRKDPVRKTPTGGNMNLNVRDNLVTMIAITAGEEAFTDVNNNGAYDESEPFDDLTEPFVDSNDNGTWDSDERYVDTNGNGTWDGKNGRWDGSSLIWVTERILWTGIALWQDLADTVDPIFKLIDPQPGITPLVKFLSAIPVTLQICDPWLNSMAQNGQSDACEVSGTDDKSPITAFPKANLGGIAVTYPSCPVLSFQIKDARDPLAPPSEQVPIRVPPIPWTVPLCCKYTSSPELGNQVTICGTSVSGLVE